MTSSVSIPREIESSLMARVREFRCLALLGARQVGKSFFLKRLAEKEGGVYVTLDDGLLRDEVRRDPLGWIQRHRLPGKLFIVDEAVRCAEVFSAIKSIVDTEDPVPTQILLSSSANFSLVATIKETLAGRAGIATMYPLSWREVVFSRSRSILSSLTSVDKFELAVRDRKDLLASSEIYRLRDRLLTTGGFPEVWIKQNPTFQKEWIDAYFSTYVLPLSSELFRIVQPSAFERLYRITSSRTAQYIHYSEIASHIGVSATTTQSYLGYLKAMMVLKELPSYYRSVAKRTVKMGKFHVTDPLLFLGNAGAPSSLASLERLGLIGNLYESWVVNEILKANDYERLGFSTYSWRTADKAEVDILLEGEGLTIPIEVKYSQKVSKRDLSGIHSFLEEHDKTTPIALLVYRGNEVNRLEQKIFSIPDALLFG